MLQMESKKEYIGKYRITYCSPHTNFNPKYVLDCSIEEKDQVLRQMERAGYLVWEIVPIMEGKNHERKKKHKHHIRKPL